MLLGCCGETAPRVCICRLYITCRGVSLSCTGMVLIGVEHFLLRDSSRLSRDVCFLLFVRWVLVVVSRFRRKIFSRGAQRK